MQLFQARRFINAAHSQHPPAEQGRCHETLKNPSY